MAFADFGYVLCARNTFNTGSYSAAGAGAFGAFPTLAAGYPSGILTFVGKWRVDTASFSGTTRGISFFGMVFTMTSSAWTQVGTVPYLNMSQEIATGSILSTVNYSNAVVVQAGTGTFNVTGLWELWGLRKTL